jgi:hypothetical protein
LSVKIAATAALNQPGGEWAALWQRRHSLASAALRLSHWASAASSLNHANQMLSAVFDFLLEGPRREIHEGFMRRVALSIGWLVLAMAVSFAAAANHDGNWTVLVVTEKGDCDRAYRYEVTVAGGRVNFAGQPGISVAGTVTANGAVKVSISGGTSSNAQGAGRLASDNDIGT